MRKFLVVLGGVVSFVICVFILVSQRKDLWIPVAFIANILIFGFLFWIVYNKDEEAREKEKKAKKEEAERAAKMKRVEEALAAKKKREEAELAAKMKLEASISSFSSSEKVQELLKKCIETIDLPIIFTYSLYYYDVPKCYDTRKPFIVAHARVSCEIDVHEDRICFKHYCYYSDLTCNYPNYPHCDHYSFMRMGYALQPDEKKRELFAELLAREIANKYKKEYPDCSITVHGCSCRRIIELGFSKNFPNINYQKENW